MKHGKELADEIFNAVFGEEGLLESEDEIQFTEARINFEHNYGQYLDKKYSKRFLDRLLKNVINPNLMTDNLPYFTNNQNETINK